MNPHRAVLALLFLCSGAGALVAETIWLRWFRELLGASAPAVSATLVAFFTGHGLGAAWASVRGTRTASPLRRYAALEAVAALACIAVPLVLSLLRGVVDDAADALREQRAWLSTARYAAALVATVPAGFCFGATLPLLVAAAGHERPAGPMLYAVNTLGAALGTAAASFGLPERIGVIGSYGVGVGLLLTAAAGAAAWRGREVDPPGAEDEAAPAAPDPLRGAAALAALSGFTALAIQLLLHQAFARVLNQSVFAFGTVTVVILIALALGAFLVDRAGDRVAARSWVSVGCCAAGVGWIAFPMVFFGTTDGLRFLGVEAPWPDYLIRAWVLAIATAGPALALQGLVFPALLREVRGSATERGEATGRLLLWNTLGAVAGALLAPYALLPWLGLWTSFAAIATLLTGIGLWIRLGDARFRLWRDAGVAIAWMIVISRGSPLTLPPLALGDADQLLYAEQTPAGLVAVIERDGGRILQIDNHYALGGTADAVRQERQGHVPLLLHPAPEHVAFLGSATGSSAAAALEHPSVRAITLVELVPAAAEAARIFFRDANRGIYEDPRTEVALDDARSFVRSTHRRFDVIVADLFVPWRAGTGSLYTVEHFEAARAKLRPGGLFCQWLPLYQLSEAEWDAIHAAFVTTFPDAVVFRGDFYGDHPIVALIGGARAEGATARDRRSAALGARGVEDRWVADPRGLRALYLGPLGPAPEGARPNRDDDPIVEFAAARHHGGGTRETLTGLRWISRAKALRERADASGPDAFAPGEAERHLLEGGHALQTASALYVSGQEAAAGRALALAAERLPRELFRDAPADPTAADVWHADEPTPRP